MGLSEYIDTVTAQMRCRRAHSPVAKELTDHIEDQKQAYIEGGMEAVEAEAEAVRQMGDAVEVGVEMDRIHRPRMNRKMLITVGIFSILACIFQGMLIAAQNNGGYVFGDARESIVQVLLGVLMMTGILFLDYTWIGKKPLVIWIVLMIGVPLVYRLQWQTPSWILLLNPHQLGRIFRYVQMGIMLPVYGGVIYHYRKKGWKGFAMCFLWLFLSVWLGWGMNMSKFTLIVNCFACMLLMTAAVAFGWIQVPRIWGLLASWGTLGAGLFGIVFYTLKFGAQYQIDRLAVILKIGGSQDYITGRMREIQQSLEIFGRGNEFGAEDFPWEGSNALLFIANRVGIAGGILLVAGLLVLFIMMAAGILKQKNVLGGLIGTGCLLGLLMPFVCHLLSNLTLIPYADAYIPFFYPGWIVNAACYTLLGLYLSVYRNTDVVA